MLTDLSKVTEMPLDLNPVVMTTGNNYTSLKSVPYAKLRVLDIYVNLFYPHSNPIVTLLCRQGNEAQRG